MTQTFRRTACWWGPGLAIAVTVTTLGAQQAPQGGQAPGARGGGATGARAGGPARGGGANAPPAIQWAAPPLADGPIAMQSAEPAHRDLRIVVMKGLSHPWGMAFLPDGGILVTERGGQLRVVRNGVVAPAPIAGVPMVAAGGLNGLMDIALHPRFAENNFVYLTYHKPVATATARRRRRPAAARVAVVVGHRRSRWHWAGAPGTAPRSPMSASSSTRASTRPRLASCSAATA